MLEDRVSSFIDQYQLIGPIDRIAVAFSGGADSTCLLLLLKNLYPDTAAIYINHNLRGIESDQEEAFIKELCKEHHIPLYIERLFWKGRPSNLEAEARKRRYRHLTKVAREHGFSKVALAHHEDDKVETILLRIIRGTGPAGLSPLTPQKGIFIRPLLSCSRDEILEYLQQRSISYFSDSSNVSLDHRRNRIRLELLPYIQKHFNPRFGDALLQMAKWVEEQNEFFQEILDPPIFQCVEYRPNSICLKRKEFVTLPRQIQKGIFRHSATYLDPHLYPSAHTTKLFFDHLDTGSDLELPGFLMVQFTPELIILKPKQGPIGLIEIDVPGAGTYLFPPANLQLVFSANKKNDLHYSSTTAYLDADLANFPFIIRNWIKGDSFQPLGMRGHKKLSDYWIDRKVPRHQRKRIPLVFQGEELVWVAGFTIDDRFKVTEKTINVLKIEMHTKNVEA